MNLSATQIALANSRFNRLHETLENSDDQKLQVIGIQLDALHHDFMNALLDSGKPDLSSVRD